MNQNMGEEKVIQKIEKIEKLDTSQTVQVDPLLEAQEAIPVSKTKFDEALARADIRWDQTGPKTNVVVALDNAATRPKPIDELGISSRKVQQLQPVTQTQLIDQAESIQTKLNSSIEKLEEASKANPQLKLPPVQSARLSGHLIHIDTSITSALGVSGVEAKKAMPIEPASAHPLGRFLSYLTDSDRKMTTLVSEIQSLNSNDQRMTPAKLLAVQIKLSFVQQELEFFSNVLNKALESTKTIMNVQV